MYSGPTAEVIVKFVADASKAIEAARGTKGHLDALNKGIMACRESADKFRNAWIQIKREAEQAGRKLTQQEHAQIKALKEMESAVRHQGTTHRQELKMTLQKLREVRQEAAKPLSTHIGTGTFTGIVKGAIIGRVVREIFDAVSALKNIYVDLLQSSLEFNMQLTQSRIGMAAMISQGHDIYVNNEKVTDGIQKYTMALEKASELQQQMLSVSNRTVITFEELNDNAMAGLALLTARKIPLEKQVELLGIILSSEKAIGIQKQQQFMEMKQLLQGDIRRGELARQLVALGKVTKEELQTLSGEALFQKLTQALAEMAVAGEAHMNTIRGKWEILVDNMKFALAGIWSDSELSSSIGSWIQSLIDRLFVKVSDAKGNVFMMLTTEGQKLIDVLTKIGKGVMQVVTWLTDAANVEKLVWWSKFALILATLVGTTFALTSVIGGLIAVVEAASVAFSRFALGPVGIAITAIGLLVAGFTMISTSVNKWGQELETITPYMVEINGQAYYLSDNLGEIAKEAKVSAKELRSLWAEYQELSKKEEKASSHSARFVELSQLIAQKAPDAAGGIDDMTKSVTILGSEVEKTIQRLENLEYTMASTFYKKAKEAEMVAKAYDNEILRASTEGAAERAKVIRTTLSTALVTGATPVREILSRLGVDRRFAKSGQPMSATDVWNTEQFYEAVNVVTAAMRSDKATTGSYAAAFEALKAERGGGNLTVSEALPSMYSSTMQEPHIAALIDALATTTNQGRDFIGAMEGYTYQVNAAVKNQVKTADQLAETAGKAEDKRAEARIYNDVLNQFDPAVVAQVKAGKTWVPTAKGLTGGTGGGAPSEAAWDASHYKMVQEAVQSYIEQLKVLQQMYRDPVWVQQEKLYESEAKALTDARIAATAKYEAAKVSGDVQAQSEAQAELVDLAMKQIDLELTREGIQRDIAAEYLKQAGISKDHVAYQDMLNTLIAEGGEGYAKLVVANQEVAKLEAQRMFILAQEPTGKDAAEKKKNADKRAAELLKIDRELQEAYRKQWLESRVYHAGLEAKRVEDSRKAAEEQRKTAEEVEKARQKAVEDTNRHYAKMIREQIDNLNDVRTTLDAQLDTLDVRRQIIEERLRQGIITADEYEKQISENKKAQEKAYDEAYKKLQQYVTQAMMLQISLQVGNAANIPLYLDLVAAIAKGNKELEKMILEQLKLNEHVKTTSELWSDVLGALDGVISKFGGANSLIGKMVSEVKGLVDTFGGLSKVQFGGVEAGSIGGFFTKAFTTGWSGFLTALPSMLNIGAGIGSLFMGIMDGIMSLFERKAERIYKRLQKELETLMTKYQNDAATIRDTLASLEALRARSVAELSGEKGGPKRLRELLPEIDKEIAAIRKEQRRIFDDMESSIKRLRIQSNLRDIFTQFDDVIKKYKEYIDAGGELVKAQEYLTLSFADMTKKLQEEYDEALRDYYEDIEDEMDNWLRGAEDDWGRLISLERKAQLDIEKAIAAYNEALAERAKERAQIQEDLAEFIADKEKEIVDIQNEGLLERRKTTEQSKLDRISAIREEILEKRKEAQERLDQLDEEDRKEKELLDQELSRINLRMERERQAHAEKMAMLDEEGLKAIENIRQQLEYLQQLVATWEQYYHTNYTEPETLARLMQAFADFKKRMEDLVSHGGWSGSFEKMFTEAGQRYSELLANEMRALGFTAESDIAASKSWGALKAWLSAHPNIVLYTDDQGVPHMVDISGFTSTAGTGSGTGSTTGSATTGSTQGASAAPPPPGTGSGLVDLAEWSSMGGATAPTAAGAIGQQNNVVITVNVTGVPVNPDTVEQHIYDQVITALDQAYRR